MSAKPKKPATLEEYKAWLRTEHGVDNIEQQRNHYEIVAEQMRKAFESLPFWKEIKEGKLKDYDEEYRLTHSNYPLFTKLDSPALETKSFDSFFDKSYRINVVQNSKWPDQPTWLRQKRWILPHNWFNAINDIVRTCLVVKYFDGVKFLQSKLQEDCEKKNLRWKAVLQAREEGHYAAHFYVSYDCDITSIRWTPEKVVTTVELQITTQLQDVIRTMLHKHYESRRRSFSPSDDWKWDHKSNEFATNYLGHILHYLEGMIVEIRDRQREQP